MKCEFDVVEERSNKYMFEEKWYNPKSFEQLKKEEMDRQFRQWILNKCKDIIRCYSDSNSDYDRNYEKDGCMIIEAYEKSTYDKYGFSEIYKVPINEFWDFDDAMDMNVEKVL